MATMEQRLVSLAQAVGADVKGININIGTLASLSTTQKSNLVAAINELKADFDSIDLTDLINDAAGSGANVVYSVDKILNLLSALKADILGGIPPSTLDTIKELADFLSDNTLAGGIVEQLSKRVRVDAAQTFTSTEQAQARSNINAASATDLTTLSNNVGNTDHNFVTDYTTAKS